MNVIGGISFFLLGMMMMAEGLKSASGEALRNMMDRFTNKPVPSIITGTVITNVTQSSTATSIMTIGFVNAGIISFAQSIGVIFGANLGSTSTAWFVAFLGVKFSISQLALPMIAIGVILMLFSRSRLPHVGKAIAGFGLLFFGIQLLQLGMEDMNGFLNFSAFSGTDMLGRLVLVIIGIVMTIIMQSSTAAVATTITMLSIGTLEIDQAIALVIGQNIGTTATAILAAMGAGVQAKRTAAAHVMFNLITAFIVFWLFPFIIASIHAFNRLMGWYDPAAVVAVFHTFFSLLGILLLTPFIEQFARMIMKMLPEKESKAAAVE
jgi:phosphate:Na+ symporter